MPKGTLLRVLWLSPTPRHVLVLMLVLPSICHYWVASKQTSVLLGSVLGQGKLLMGCGLGRGQQGAECDQGCQGVGMNRGSIGWE